MKKTKIAINGIGRIGRAFFKLVHDDEDLEVVAINDLGDVRNLAYLMQYDSVYGRSPFSVEADGDSLIIAGKKLPVLHVANPSELPWKEMDIDVVVEATGVFASYEKSKAHLDAGAKRVVISAPVKDEPEGINGATVLMGVNDEKLATCDISSNASCTTNAASPVMQILECALDIEKAVLNTVHAYTSTQSLVDGPTKSSDLRRGRAAATNMVPSTTGAATAVRKAVDGVPFFDGTSVRVPVPVGSYVDLVILTKKDTSADEVNDILREASKEDRWKGIFTVSEEPLVSSDIIGDIHASIADLTMTKVIGGNLGKVMSWYDNETGYAHALLQHVKKSGSFV